MSFGSRFLPAAWPTWVLVATIYCGWLGLTWFHRALPLPLLALAGGWIGAWHMSLQHELMHGHLARRRGLNEALGFPPLSLWLPYALYRKSHLAHHRAPELTDPFDDPESFYRASEPGPAMRLVWRIHNTLPGRMLLGPPLAIWGTLRDGARDVLARTPGARRLWLMHGVGVAAVLGWLRFGCGMGLGTYVGCFVYPGLALALVRSFAEHRADEVPEHRTAVVEDGGLLGLLFLHNNLHVVHHLRPDLPWYEIGRFWRAHRERLVALNGGHVYDGYGSVLKRYFLTPHHVAQHPARRA